MFNNIDFHSTTIEIDSKQNLIDLKQFDHHFDLHKDLIEFNQLDDIFNFCNPRNTIIVKLKKSQRGLGIALTGGKKFEIDDQLEESKEQNNNNLSLINQLIRVKKTHPAHPASECGLIEENDFILDVNGHCFVGLTYIQCPLELKRLLQPKELNESLFDHSINESFREPNIFESTRIIDLNEEKINTTTQLVKNKITLIKKDNSLGFILSKIENEGFYIKQITKEPASLAKISPGDKILNVNGVSLDGLDLSSAISFLRSLPNICELELEQTINCDSSLDNSLSYNDQSETEDDNRFKKRELRHEVKIMLDSRSKDSLHKRLKRKELKKIKDQDSTKEQNLTNERINKESLEQNCSKEECNRSDKENNKFNKENIDIFMKLNNNNNQFTNESSFLRQSSVMEFGKKLSNENSVNNLNKWRNAVLNEDIDELDKKNMFKRNNLKEEQDSTIDSGFINDSSITKINLINKSNLFNKVNQDLINLNDIQLKLNNNCLLNENSKLYRNIDALFFHVYLDRKMAGRLGFSITDDQSNDYRIVNTIKHGFSACVVKMVYPNSIAFNSNIKIGDKLLEVNDQQMINKPVQQVINELRKIKGKIKLLFLRKIY